MERRISLTLTAALAAAAAADAQTPGYYSHARFVDGSRRTYDKRKKQVSETNHLRERIRNLKHQGKVLCLVCGRGYRREEGKVIEEDLEKRGYPAGMALGHGCSQPCAEKDLEQTLKNLHTW